MFHHGTHNKEINQMKKWSLLATALCLPVLAFGQGREDLSTTGEPPMLGIHWARGHDAHGHGGGGRSPLMTLHGGNIMTTAVTKNIFWGPSWSNFTFTADKITGLETWYMDFNGSNYAKTSDEYNGLNGLFVGPNTTHQGNVVDTSASAGGGSTSAILAEVCTKITPDPSGNGYYSVYSDLPRGNAGYCAYHSAGTCSGKPVQFAFFWNLDGDAGCDPQDTSGLHSQGLAALANVSGHELSEARTDPGFGGVFGGWQDSSGQENGDKCAWTFNVPLVTFAGSKSQWKIQGEWSNAAFTANTGYPNSSGQHGCIDGH